jgi:hypothetical protein
MVTRESPLQRARLVLTIFEIFGCQAGDKLVLGNLVVVGAKHGLTPFDITAGVDTGCTQGWFNRTPDKAIRLTEYGFAALHVHDDQQARFAV